MILATSAGYFKYWQYGKTREFRVKSSGIFWRKKRGGNILKNREQHRVMSTSTCGFNQLKLKYEKKTKTTTTKQMGKLYLMTKTRRFSVESHRCCKVHGVYGYKLIIAKLYTWCLPGLYLYSAPIYLEITQEKYVNLMCLFSSFYMFY